MKIHVRHTFPCDCDTFWEMFWDDRYNEMLNEGSSVRREVLEDRTEGRARHWRVRTIPERELPGAVKALIGADRLEYEQVNHLDLDASVLMWEVVPQVMTDKVSAKGTMTIAPSADGGCERVIDGDIDVRIPLVGGRVEKAIVAEVERGYASAAEVAHRWLSERSIG